MLEYQRQKRSNDPTFELISLSVERLIFILFLYFNVWMFLFCIFSKNTHWLICRFFILRDITSGD